MKNIRTENIAAVRILPGMTLSEVIKKVEAQLGEYGVAKVIHTRFPFPLITSSERKELSGWLRKNFKCFVTGAIWEPYEYVTDMLSAGEDVFNITFSVQAISSNDFYLDGPTVEFKREALDALRAFESLRETDSKDGD